MFKNSFAFDFNICNEILHEKQTYFNICHFNPILLMLPGQHSEGKHHVSYSLFNFYLFLKTLLNFHN